MDMYCQQFCPLGHCSWPGITSEVGRERKGSLGNEAHLSGRNVSGACRKVFGVHGSLSLRAAYAPPLSEAAHDPECDCREAEAPLQGRFQGTGLRDDGAVPCRMANPMRQERDNHTEP